MNFKFEKVRELPKLGFLYYYLEKLNDFYPNHKEWYYNKFIPSVLLGNDIALVMKNKYEEIIGVSLLKNTEEEIKLRALRINPKFQKRGYGLYLIDESLRELDNPLPHCTTAEEITNDYARIFINRYGFSINRVERGLYRKGKNEYLWNL